MERISGGTGGDARGTLIAFALVASMACVPPSPPAPAELPPPDAPAGVAAGDPAEDLENRRPTAYGEPELRAPLEAELPPAPAAVWIAPEVLVWPEEPAEGTAVSLLVRPRPGARAPLSVEASLDGRTVPLSTVEGGWFGIGALPIGAGGSGLLSLRYRVAPDSVIDELRPVAIRSRDFPARQLRVEPRYVEPPVEVLARITRERERIRGTLAFASPDWRAGAFDWPRPPELRSGFGERRLFNERLQGRHWGLDLAGTEGELVHAAADGRVVLADDFYYQGGAVYVDHGLGVYTAYFHLSRIDVTEGQEVRRGEALGAVGATGRVTGPHLHWSAIVGGQSVDPASLLDLRLPSAPSDSPLGLREARVPAEPPDGDDTAEMPLDGERADDAAPAVNR